MNTLYMLAFESCSCSASPSFPSVPTLIHTSPSLLTEQHRKLLFNNQSKRIIECTHIMNQDWLILLSWLVTNLCAPFITSRSSRSLQRYRPVSIPMFGWQNLFPNPPPCASNHVSLLKKKQVLREPASCQNSWKGKVMLKERFGCTIFTIMYINSNVLKLYDSKEIYLKLCLILRQNIYKNKNILLLFAFSFNRVILSPYLLL